MQKITPCLWFDGNALEAANFYASLFKNAKVLSEHGEGHEGAGVEGKPLITRVSVKYHIKVPKGKKGEAERIVENHEKFCAVSQSLRRGITVELQADVVEV